MPRPKRTRRSPPDTEDTPKKRRASRATPDPVDDAAARAERARLIEDAIVEMQEPKVEESPREFTDRAVRNRDEP